MKKIFVSAFIAVSILTSISCNKDTVELKPIGYTEAGFFSSEQEFDWAAKGIYMKIGIYFAFQNDPGRVIACLFMLPDDDLTTRNGGFAEENFTGLNGANDRISRFYNASYQAIQRANTLLEQIEQRGDVYTVNPELKNWHKGEALFLRSYVNFMLWNVFGTAPVVNTRIKSVAEANEMKNSTGTELLDQAINDLEEAATLLPQAWPATLLNLPTLGRATQNSAYGLRAKALVFRATVSGSTADYTSAIADINSIAGRSLMDNYAKNFDASFENNAESLFEYQANRSIGNANAALPPDDFAAIGEISHYVGYYNQMPSWIGDRFHTATEDLYNAYPAGDPRVGHIFKDAPAFTGTTPNIVKYVERGSWLPGNTPPGGNGLNANNPRILRYAEALLLKAEAIAMSGGDLDEAIDLINEIRKRARESTDDGIPAAEPADRPSSADKAVVLGWIFEERRLEFPFEHGTRWFDLRRRHLAADPVIKIDLENHEFYSVQVGTKFEVHNVYFPLPNGDVQQLPHVDQNDGY